MQLPIDQIRGKEKRVGKKKKNLAIHWGYEVLKQSLSSTQMHKNKR